MGLTFNNGRNAAAMTSTSSLNVGIGTASPNYKLQVAPSAVYGNAEDGNISINASSSGGTVTSPTTVGGIVFGDSNVTNGYLGRLAVIQDNPSSTTASHMRFYTNGGGGNGSTTEKVRITSVGNVGIGTSSPSYQLDVQNGSSPSLRVRNTALGGTSTLLLETANDFSGTCQTYIKCIGSTGNGQSQLTFGTAGATGDSTATERMRINNVGNVGIGTSSPLQALGTTLTVAGTLLSNPSVAGGNYNENIRANRAGNGYSAIAIGSAYNTVSGTGTGQWTLVATPVAVGYRFDFDYAGATKSYIDTSGNYVIVSDRNKKKDFEDSTIGLNAILNLKPTLYRMKDEDDSSKKQLGFIAQEVNEFIPQAYSETLDGFIGLQDRPIIAALVKAVQELEARIKTLENK